MMQDNVELESQFILRMPPMPAAAMRAVVASGVANLKDRLTIQIEQDMRHGTVVFDGWSLPAKVVDLPTIIESLKTLDGKTFYKTADICQMMICREDAEEDKTDGEESKRKDGRDKKHQFSHGITPPLKNVRKKRFRKTLKKKFFDVPEIEKEVKRLFRSDGDAFHVKYEVVNTEDEKNEKAAIPGTSQSGLTNTNSQGLDIVEHDLFGEVLSSSDEEDTRAQETDEGSRSQGVARASTSSQKDIPGDRYMTEFPSGMLNEQENRPSTSDFDITAESSTAAAAVAALEEADDMNTSGDMSASANDDFVNRLSELEAEIAAIRDKRQIQESEIADIENSALVQRFQDIIDDLKRQENEKKREYEEILSILNG